jgi:hypothetical protein
VREVQSCREVIISHGRFLGGTVGEAKLENKRGLRGRSLLHSFTLPSSTIILHSTFTISTNFNIAPELPPRLGVSGE